MTVNGKVKGNGELVSGVNSSTPISSTNTSPSSRMLTSGDLRSMNSD